MNTETVKRTIHATLAAEQFDRVTPESLRSAQLAQLTERQALERDYGITFDPFRDGQVVLHLWRPTHVAIPTPPPELIGTL